MPNTPQRGNLFFLLLILYRVCVEVIVTFFISAQSEFIDLNLWMAAGELIIFLPPLLLYLHLTRQKLSQVVPHEELSLTNLGLIILMSLSIQPLMMFISYFSSLFFTNNVSETLTASLDSQPFFITLTAIALIPAVCEEITMRGVVLSNYCQVDIKKAAIVNGLFFGILHMNPVQFLYAAVMGAIFTYLVRYTRSIYASVIAHFVINGSQSLLALWVQSLTKTYPEFFVEAPEPTFAEKLSSLGDMALIALIFLPVFVFILRNFILYNKKRNIGILLTEKVMTHLDQNPLARPKVFNWAFWVVTMVYVGFIVLVMFGTMLMNI